MGAENSNSHNNSADVPMLEVRSITKKFGELVANDAVSLKVGKGEIHALLGENGAGKSTLVKMLYGSLQPDGGQIIWHGNQTNILSPSQARQTGIGMVFQHFSLFDSLTVAENIALSLDKQSELGNIGEKAQQVSQDYGLPLKPDTIIGDMSVGERQRVEIVRCLLQNPELIILDEPTSVLTPQEADALFETLERLKAEGRSILYISHRLDEVQKLCDHATILRHGKVVGHCEPANETAASLASLMVGEDIGEVHQREAPELKDIALQVNKLSVPAGHQFAVALKDINLNVYAGEVVGIAGIAGNGQSEFFAALSGEDLQAKADEVVIDGHNVGHTDISSRRKIGAAFVPEERLGHGAVPELTLSENMLLARHASDRNTFQKFGRLGVISRGAIENATKRVSAAMDVRKSGENPPAGSLSGGNLQKFIMGRELDREPMLMIVNQPTWGVDAGAAAHIRQALIDLAASGSAVLVISQDLDEILEVASSIAVLAEGRLSPSQPAKELTREDIGLLMARTHNEQMVAGS